jgi:hypothetical protein
MVMKEVLHGGSTGPFDVIDTKQDLFDHEECNPIDF